MRHENESAIEYLRRIVNNLDLESGEILDDLKTIPALVEFVELWDKYGTEYLEGIWDAIENDGADPKPLRDFVEKYNLQWEVPDPVKEYPLYQAEDDPHDA